MLTALLGVLVVGFSRTPTQPAEPTETPSAAPSVYTEAPSAFPTSAPTHSPTDAPTPAPEPSTRPADDPEKRALRWFFLHTSGPQWYRNAAWSHVQDKCKWEGVICDQRKVIGLILPSNNLVGIVESSLHDLTKLQILVLDGNALRGDLLTILRRMPNLRYVSLAHNHGLIGNCADLSTLPNLTSLSLIHTQIQCRPQEFVQLNATFLEHLVVAHAEPGAGAGASDLSFTNLENGLNDFSKLKTLALFDSSLTGALPAQLPSSLENIILHNNRFSCELPTLTNPLKRSLVFPGNFFTGAIPPEWRSDQGGKDSSFLVIKKNDQFIWLLDSSIPGLIVLSVAVIFFARPKREFLRCFNFSYYYHHHSSFFNLIEMLVVFLIELSVFALVILLPLYQSTRNFVECGSVLSYPSATYFGGIIREQRAGWLAAVIFSIYNLLVGWFVFRTQSPPPDPVQQRPEQPLENPEDASINGGGAVPVVSSAKPDPRPAQVAPSSLTTGSSSLPSQRSAAGSDVGKHSLASLGGGSPVIPPSSLHNAVFHSEGTSSFGPNGGGNGVPSSSSNLSDPNRRNNTGLPKSSSHVSGTRKSGKRSSRGSTVPLSSLKMQFPLSIWRMLLVNTLWLVSLVVFGCPMLLYVTAQMQSSNSSGGVKWQLPFFQTVFHPVVGPLLAVIINVFIMPKLLRLLSYILYPTPQHTTVGSGVGLRALRSSWASGRLLISLLVINLFIPLAATLVNDQNCFMAFTQYWNVCSPESTYFHIDTNFSWLGTERPMETLKAGSAYPYLLTTEEVCKGAFRTGFCLRSFLGWYGPFLIRQNVWMGFLYPAALLLKHKCFAHHDRHWIEGEYVVLVSLFELVVVFGVFTPLLVPVATVAFGFTLAVMRFVEQAFHHYYADSLDPQRHGSVMSVNSSRSTNRSSQPPKHEVAGPALGYLFLGPILSIAFQIWYFVENQQFLAGYELILVNALLMVVFLVWRLLRMRAVALAEEEEDWEDDDSMEDEHDEMEEEDEEEPQNEDSMLQSTIEHTGTRNAPSRHSQTQSVHSQYPKPNPQGHPHSSQGHHPHHQPHQPQRSKRLTGTAPISVGSPNTAHSIHTAASSPSANSTIPDHSQASKSKKKPQNKRDKDREWDSQSHGHGYSSGRRETKEGKKT